MTEALNPKPFIHKKIPPAPLEYLRRWPIQAALIFVTGFLYIPLISLMIFSFNDFKGQCGLEGVYTQIL